MNTSLQRLWHLVAEDLKRAYSDIPEKAASDHAVAQFGEYLEHNELELAVESLASFGKNQPVPAHFWIALGDAALKMELTDRATAFAYVATTCNVRISSEG